MSTAAPSHSWLGMVMLEADIRGPGTMQDVKEPQEEDELVVVAGADPETRNVTVVRHTPEGVAASVLSPVRSGQPLTGDMVRLKPMPRFPLLARMRRVLRHPDSPGAREPTDDVAPACRTFLGSTEAYRRGWEAVFGKPPVDSPKGDPEVN